MVVLRFALIVVLAALIGATLPALLMGDSLLWPVIFACCLLGTAVVAIAREIAIRPGWGRWRRAGVTVALGAGVGGMMLIFLGPLAVVGALYGAACMLVWSLLDAVIPTPKTTCWIYQSQRR
jgi:hypothetical protein